MEFAESGRFGVADSFWSSPVSGLVLCLRSECWIMDGRLLWRSPSSQVLWFARRQPDIADWGGLSSGRWCLLGRVRSEFRLLVWWTQYGVRRVRQVWCCELFLELVGVRLGSVLAVCMLDHGVGTVAQTGCLEVVRTDGAACMVADELFSGRGLDISWRGSSVPIAWFHVTPGSAVVSFRPSPVLSKPENLAKNCLWKRCPNCKFFVERTTGCIFIKCSYFIVSVFFILESTTEQDHRGCVIDVFPAQIGKQAKATPPTAVSPRLVGHGVRGFFGLPLWCSGSGPEGTHLISHPTASPSNLLPGADSAINGLFNSSSTCNHSP
ncbi:hypothetical protein KSP40_PGU008770 [Platanthera guangdongensis]|uniref:Uncharacterized protein n=1 Tax=Platanthera guangdongensis TaxID=2320717 RepID=A0ABR2MSA5_9ASPA